MTPARRRVALADKYSKNASPKDRLYIAAIKAKFDRQGDKLIIYRVEASYKLGQPIFLANKFKFLISDYGQLLSQNKTKLLYF